MPVRPSACAAIAPAASSGRAQAGALAGMLGGRTLSKQLSGSHLQIGFAAVSAVVAVGMFAKAL